MATASKSVKSRRFRLIVSLRTLLLVVLVAGCSLGWIAHQSRIQRTAVDAIRKNGIVHYNYQYFDDTDHPQRKSWVPSQLLKALGEDCFHKVTSVELFSIELSGTERQGPVTNRLAPLAVLGRLEMLETRYIQVADSDLASIAGLSRLRVLVLPGEPEFLKPKDGTKSVKITDAGMVHLRGLTDLRELILDDTDVGDAGLYQLRAMKKLRKLHLGGTRSRKVTDAGLAHVAGMTELQDLTLDNTEITDEGLRHLEGLTHLQALDLGFTTVTGAGVAKLVAGFKELRELNLWGIPLEARDLQIISRLPHLQKLSIEASEKVQASLAGCTELLELYLTPVGALDPDSITDEGMGYLRGLAKLRLIYLNGSNITDEGLVYLRELRELQSLDLSYTLVTDEGIAELQKALPNLKIEHTGLQNPAEWHRPKPPMLDPKSDLDRLHGSWQTLSFVRDGFPFLKPSKRPPFLWLEYDGNKWSNGIDNQVSVHGTIQIDATKTPKEIDIMGDSGVKDENTCLGIYELDGDNYKLCYAPPGKSRPTKFETIAGSGAFLFTYKRAKP